MEIVQDILLAFISHNYDVYNGNNSAIITLLVCSNCKGKWMKSIRECYYCSSIIPFVKSCKSCGEMASLTGAKTAKCGNGHSEFAQVCINENCQTKINPKLREMVFLKEKSAKSPHTIAHSSCLECPNKKSVIISVTISSNSENPNSIKIEETETGVKTIFETEENNFTFDEKSELMKYLISKMK